MARPTAQHLRKALPREVAGRSSTAASGSLTASVTERIRTAIVEGRLALGEALSELRLAEALGVSRTPVRDALTALQLEGLIDVRPQAGSFVFKPSDEGLAELAEFRRVLETAALRLCHARRLDDALRQLRAAADAMDRARDADDRLGLSRADTAFHQALVDHSANAYLVAAYRLVSGRVAALRTHNLMAGGLARRQSLTEHRSIIGALAKGDLQRAEQVLQEHIWQMRGRYRLAQDRSDGETAP